MAARLRHQLTAEGRVFISLSVGLGGQAPAGGHMSREEAKAFAWGLLADLDPHEAHRRGAPEAAFGFAQGRAPKRAAPRVRQFQPYLSRYLRATPGHGSAAFLMSNTPPPELGGVQPPTLCAALCKLRRLGLVEHVGGERGQGGGFHWRRTEAGDRAVAEADETSGGEGA